jgi:hypothetical protein
MTGSVGIDTIDAIDGVRPVGLRDIDGVDLCGFILIEVGKYWGEPRENEDLFRLGSRRSERPGAIDNNVRHLSAPIGSHLNGRTTSLGTLAAAGLDQLRVKLIGYLKLSNQLGTPHTTCDPF